MTEDSAPNFYPSAALVQELAFQAVSAATRAGLATAVIHLRTQLDDGPPEQAEADAAEQWRASHQATLSELMQQLLHADAERTESEINMTAIDEAVAAAEHGVRTLIPRIAESAQTQAWVVASVERRRISDAISPPPPTQQSPDNHRGQRRIHLIRASVGNAVFVAGDHAGTAAEWVGLLIGRVLRTPLQWAAGVIAGESR